MPFNPAVRAETTGWKNNCGFNCLTHFLVDELESNTADALTKQYSEPAYQLFLKSFAETYSIPTATVPFLQTLVKHYANPIDREVIFGPVLRQCLGSIMLERRNPEDYLGSFYADVISFLNDSPDPFNNRYAVEANLDWLDELKAAYQKQMASLQKARAGAAGAQVGAGAAGAGSVARLDIDPASFVTLENVREFWLKQGFKKYIDELSDSSKSPPIAPDELATLTQALDIGLKVFSASNRNEPFYPIPQDRQKKQRVLTVFNGGRHWEYEATDSIIAYAHNVPYQVVAQINALLRQSAYPDRKRMAELAAGTGATFHNILMPLDAQALVHYDITLAIQGVYLSIVNDQPLPVKVSPVPAFPLIADPLSAPIPAGNNNGRSPAAVSLGLAPVADSKHQDEAARAQPASALPIRPAFGGLDRKLQDEELRLEPISAWGDYSDLDDESLFAYLSNVDATDSLAERSRHAVEEDRNLELAVQASLAASVGNVRPSEAASVMNEPQAQGLVRPADSLPNISLPAASLPAALSPAAPLPAASLPRALLPAASLAAASLPATSLQMDRVVPVRDRQPTPFLPSAGLGLNSDFNLRLGSGLGLGSDLALTSDHSAASNGQNGHIAAPVPARVVDTRNEAQRLKETDMPGYVRYLEERVRTLEATVRTLQAADADRKTAAAARLDSAVPARSTQSLLAARGLQNGTHGVHPAHPSPGKPKTDSKLATKPVRGLSASAVSAAGNKDAITARAQQGAGTARTHGASAARTLGASKTVVVHKPIKAVNSKV